MDGVIPSVKIREDDDFVAILDAFPNRKGMTLVITKDHMDSDILAKDDDSLPNSDTFLTDPEACPRPIYRKYLQYLKDESKDESGVKNYCMKTFNLIILLLLLF